VCSVVRDAEGYPLLMLVVTTNDLPGWEIQRVCGEVFGLTVRLS
jgi:hypothetical protein